MALLFALSSLVFLLGRAQSVPDLWFHTDRLTSKRNKYNNTKFVSSVIPSISTGREGWLGTTRGGVRNSCVDC
jgi:hypothetical protein